MLSLFFTSCGDLIGFSSESTPDPGDLQELEISISNEELSVLYDSVVIDSPAVCRVGRDDASADATIKIRGLTSRMLPKKSFTIEVDDVKYALDAGGDPWLGYSLAMKAYSLTGLPAMPFDPVALLLNDKYLGYYNVVALYNEDLNDFYNADKGELFKIELSDFGYDFPIEGRSEKKFPDNNDFGSLNRLLTNCMNMDSDEWVSWVELNTDLESIASYMVVRDYFGTIDTGRLNFYLYFSPEAVILPWDNDRGYTYCEVGGNNPLTERMLESDEFREIYTSLFTNYFLDDSAENPDYLIDDLMIYLDDLRDLLDQSARVEPAYFLEYSAFIEEYESILRFFSERGETIFSSDKWKELSLNTGF